MTRRLFRLAAIAALLLGTAAVFVRVQPPQTITLFRNGSSVVSRRMLLFIRPLTSEGACRASTMGDAALHVSTSVVRTRTGDELDLPIRVLYRPPAAVPNGWPAGDWCASLEARIARAATTWAAGTSADAILADRRAIAHAASEAIARDLASAGVLTTDVKVRVDLPAGFERLRSIPQIAARSHRTAPVIFIGLDGADWELLDTYIANGSMPVLQRLVKEGTSGALVTEHPPLSPLVWTTMFTGTGPLDHQILDFTRFNPVTHEREPITSDERRVPAIWNMVSDAGKRVAVFGVWATYAAEPVHGLLVSDRLFTFLYTEKDVPPGAVFPPARGTWARARLAEAERAVDKTRLRDYLPWLTDEEYAAAEKSDNPYARPASALRRILVETEVYRRLSSDVLREGALPDLTILYLQGTDTIGHVFAPYAPPRQPSIAPADFDRYNAVPLHYFHEIDALLGEYAALAQRSGAILVIASDHGFRWREGRPAELSSFAAASAAKWHRNEGIFLVRGPGIAASQGHTARAGVRQLCATLASLTGVPMPQGIDTHPLPGVAPSRDELDYKPFFQRAPAPPSTAGSKASSEEIAKLRALGYIGSTEAPRPQTAVAAGETKTAGAYNNAGLILREQKRTAEAIAAFEKAIAIDPGYASAKWNLSETLLAGRQQLDRADTLLLDAVREGLPEGEKYVIGRAIQYQRSGDTARATRLLDGAIAMRASDAELHLFRGRYRMDRGDCTGALADFNIATETRPDALAFASRGLAQMCLGDSASARASFERSLQLDPNQPMLQQYLQR
jgi:tetratricopeptide (TPR) repeat protein